MVGNVFKYPQSGFVAITTILILSVIILSIATSVTLLSIGEAQSGLVLFKGESTLQFVEGCTEDALLKARSDANLVSTTFTRPEGTCVITISKVGVTWTMDVTNNLTDYKRTIRVIFDRNPSGITLTSWKEI